MGKTGDALMPEANFRGRRLAISGQVSPAGNVVTAGRAAQELSLRPWPPHRVKVAEGGQSTRSTAHALSLNSFARIVDLV
jgi:hypothetical protein